MEGDFWSYSSIKKWKEENIGKYRNHVLLLNEFHDTVMEKVFELAEKRVGNPPCDYCWFVTGSGGRREQAVAPDQDHGLIFERIDQETEHYFFRLGNELSEGLHLAGYPFCPGKVMASNPLWCESVSGWMKQLDDWLKAESFESVRYLQIFFDARCLKGKEHFLLATKHSFLRSVKQNPTILQRFAENTMSMKRATGPFGQIIVEERGRYHGSVHLKNIAYLPYINAVRLLSLKEGIYETSTTERIRTLLRLPHYKTVLESVEKSFPALLQYRLKAKGCTYEDAHYIHWMGLSQDEKVELKKLIKIGRRFHKRVHHCMVKGGEYGF